MKSLKYVIVSAILAFGIAAPMVSAQDDSAPKAKRSGGSHDMTAAWLKGITDLTADQQKQIDAIKADIQAKKVTPKDAKDKVRNILTDEQKTTFDANAAKASKGKDSSKGASSKKSKKGKGGEGGGGGGDE